MSRISRNRGLVVSTLFLALGMVLAFPKIADAQTQIKPRIMIIFDTSGSMADEFASGADTNGDGRPDRNILLIGGNSKAGQQLQLAAEKVAKVVVYGLYKDYKRDGSGMLKALVVDRLTFLDDYNVNQ